MEQHKKIISEFINQLLKSMNKPFESTTELERQILATFTFGAIHAQSILNHLSPSDVHALAIFTFITEFRYSSEQARAFIDHLIQVSTNENINPTTNAIIHRGIDGHKQFFATDLPNLKKNLTEIFNVICG